MEFAFIIAAGLCVVALGALSRQSYGRVFEIPRLFVRFGKAWGRTTDRYLVLRSLNTFFYITGMVITLTGVTLGLMSILGKPAAPPPAPAVVNNTLETAEVFRLVNTERQKADVGELKIDERLNGIAQARLKDMIDNQYYAHLNPDGKYFYDLFPEYEIAADYSCENLDIQFTTDEIYYIEDWMNSTKGHKECLLNEKVNSAGYAAGLFSEENGQKVYLVVGIHSTSISTAKGSEAKTIQSLLP